MSNMISWIAAEAERPGMGAGAELPKRRGRGPTQEELLARGVGAHQFPARKDLGAVRDAPRAEENPDSHTDQTTAYENQGASWDEFHDEERERRIYRGRTVAMLRRYMRFAIETGRLPSLLGREFFRAKVTSYTVVTFEDRVIFVHDMEKCLQRLDEFSRKIIARHILQEHDQAATGKLLHCTERTVRTYVPIALDLLTEILLETGLLEPIDSNRKNSCQEGESDQISVSDCEEGENKF